MKASRPLMSAAVSFGVAAAVIVVAEILGWARMGYGSFVVLVIVWGSIEIISNVHNNIK
jgi:hypothetical protein